MKLVNFLWEWDFVILSKGYIQCTRYKLNWQQNDQVNNLAIIEYQMNEILIKHKIAFLDHFQK